MVDKEWVAMQKQVFTDLAVYEKEFLASRLADLSLGIIEQKANRTAERWKCGADNCPCFFRESNLEYPINSKSL
jgi:hypothetical protein